MRGLRPQQGQHCKACRRCTRSAYLEHCQDCSDCEYCFGCVGLDKKAFHILNDPYDRQAYFTLVSQLSRQLGNIALT